eukprot:2361913-Lingulodinium_polyedra.AAC.1
MLVHGPQQPGLPLAPGPHHRPHLPPLARSPCLVPANIARLGSPYWPLRQGRKQHPPPREARPLRRVHGGD